MQVWLIRVDLAKSCGRALSEGGVTGEMLVMAHDKGADVDALWTCDYKLPELAAKSLVKKLAVLLDPRSVVPSL